MNVFRPHGQKNSVAFDDAFVQYTDENVRPSNCRPNGQVPVFGHSVSDTNFQKTSTTWQFAKNRVASDQCQTRRRSQKSTTTTTICFPAERQQLFKKDSSSQFQQFSNFFQTQLSAFPATNTKSTDFSKEAVEEEEEEGIYEEIDDVCARQITESQPTYEPLLKKFLNSGVIQKNSERRMSSRCRQKQIRLHHRRAPLRDTSVLYENVQTKENIIVDINFNNNLSVDSNSLSEGLNDSNTLNRAFLNAHSVVSPDKTRWNPCMSVIPHMNSITNSRVVMKCRSTNSVIYEQSLEADNTRTSLTSCGLRGEADDTCMSLGRGGVADRSSDYFSYSSDSLNETCRTADKSFTASGGSSLTETYRDVEEALKIATSEMFGLVDPEQPSLVSVCCVFLRNNIHLSAKNFFILV